VKKLLPLMTLLLTFSAEAGTEMLICEGKIGSQDITLLDDNHKVGIYKGKVDIASGPRGNNIPLALFSGGELNFSRDGADCKLVVNGQSKGAFTLAAPCNGEGAGKITALNLPTLELTSELVDVTCRLEELNRAPRRQEPTTRGNSNNNQGPRVCIGSSYAPTCDD
jgi:hypothetical protein